MMGFSAQSRTGEAQKSLPTKLRENTIETFTMADKKGLDLIIKTTAARGEILGKTILERITTEAQAKKALEIPSLKELYAKDPLLRIRWNQKGFRLPDVVAAAAWTEDKTWKR